MSEFFFARESARPAALLRVVLGTLLLLEAAVRWPYAVELFSMAGRTMPVFAGTSYIPPVPSPMAAVAMHTLLVWSLACVVTGWRSRASLLIAAVLAAWLGLLDLPGTYKKYSVISLHLMALLSLTACGGAWSIDAWLKRSQPETTPRMSPRWPRRLMQILLCSIYLGAAVTKIRLPDFATGEMLEFALLGDEFGGKPAGHWLLVHPALLTAASFATLFFEMLLPALVWVPRLRRTMLLLAATFHLTLQMTMHLGMFSWIMLAGLLAFVTDDDLDAVGRLLNTVLPRSVGWAPPTANAPTRDESDSDRSRWAVPTLQEWALWLACGAAFVVCGSIAQRAADWYGVFHDSPIGGRIAIDSDLIDEILLEQPPAYEDYVHRMELGTRLTGGRVLGQRTIFHRGMIVQAAARFVQRHPSLRLDWLLIAPDGSEVARLSHRLDASVSHAAAGFEMTEDSPAGRYRVILQADGFDVAERDFEVAESP